MFSLIFSIMQIRLLILNVGQLGTKMCLSNHLVPNSVIWGDWQLRCESFRKYISPKMFSDFSLIAYVFIIIN